MKRKKKIVLPKKLKIGAHIWRVFYPKNELNCTSSESYDKKVIRVGNKVNFFQEKIPTKILLDLIHELLHVIDEFTGHYVFEDKNGKDDEGAIDAFSEVILMIICDNFERIIRAIVKSGFPLKRMVDKIHEED